MSQQNITVSSRVTIPFGTFCWITWLVFLILKLTNVLPTSFTWFWVWFPFWLPFALFGAVMVIALIIALFIAIFDNADL